MKTSTFVCGLCAALGFAALSTCLPSGWAAEQNSAAKNSPSTRETRGPEYDLEIVDGQVLSHGRKLPASLANVVEVLRDRYRQANIVLSPRLGTCTVSDLKLRASRLPEELEALRIATGNKFIVHPPAGPPSTIDPNTGLPVQAPDYSSGLFVLEAVRTPDSERVVEAFNVGPYLQWVREHPRDESQKEQRPEENLERIQKIVLETLQRFNPDSFDQNRVADFAYYRDANLFVIIGSREAVDIARKIINVLPGMASIDNSVASHYGLNPAAPPGAPDARMDEFRRRYGLGPASAQPPERNAPAQPATK